jgi:hypothetical protein
MSQFNQEKTARRFDSSRYDAGYECELPDDVMAEFANPRRPRILERPICQPPTRGVVLKWVGAVAIPALILVCVISSWQREGATSERANASQASSLPLAPQPTPAPGPARSWQEGSAQHPEQFPYAKAAPRATLVKLPPPRAQLISLPEWKPGETRPVMMPYNLEVLATYRGQLQSQDMLPSSGNQLGDTWVVGDTPWVWIWAPGAARADWIDP